MRERARCAVCGFGAALNRTSEYEKEKKKQPTKNVKRRSTTQATPLKSLTRANAHNKLGALGVCRLEIGIQFGGETKQSSVRALAESHSTGGPTTTTFFRTFKFGRRHCYSG